MNWIEVISAGLGGILGGTVTQMLQQQRNRL